MREADRNRVDLVVANSRGLFECSSQLRISGGYEGISLGWIGSKGDLLVISVFPSQRRMIRLGSAAFSFLVSRFQGRPCVVLQQLTSSETPLSEVTEKGGGKSAKDQTLLGDRSRHERLVEPRDLLKLNEMNEKQTEKLFFSECFIAWDLSMPANGAESRNDSRCPESRVCEGSLLAFHRLRVPDQISLVNHRP